MSHCPDCAHRVKSWQEYCPRCGAEIYRPYDPNRKFMNKEGLSL